MSLAIFTTIIFVIDIQDSYHNPIARLIDFLITAFQDNPQVNFEIFVHKAEALQEEYRTGEPSTLLALRISEAFV